MDFLLVEAFGAGDAAAVTSFVMERSQEFVWHREPFWLAAAADGALRGRIEVGENVEDEWWIAKQLFEYSRTAAPEAVFRLTDADGQFLLIEAATELPNWVSPGNAEFRLFLKAGELHLLPRRLPASSLAEALRSLADAPADKTLAPVNVRHAVAYRVAQAAPNVHRTELLLPLRAAAALREAPELGLAAVDAFYQRDPAATRAAARAPRFGAGPLVPFTARLSRWKYAQLLQQEFAPPKIFHRPIAEAPAVLGDKRSALSLGVKLATGLELLDPEPSNSVLPGEYDYGAAVQAALRRGLSAPLPSATSFVPSAGDGTTWLDIDPNELDERLRRYEQAVGELGEEGEENEEGGEEEEEEEEVEEDMTAQDAEELNAIVEAMQGFLTHSSGLKGVEVPRSAAADVALDVDAVLKVLGQALPKASVPSAPADPDDSDETSDDEGGEEEEEEEEEEEDSEEELDPEQMERERQALADYMAEMDSELMGTTLDSSFARPEEADPDAPLNLDFNLVSSLLASFSAQEGLSGPGSNLLGEMGIKLPPPPK